MVLGDVHLCKELDKIVNIKDSTKLLASDSYTNIIAKGSVWFTTDVFGEKKNVPLNDPDLRTNILSISKITTNKEILLKMDKAFTIGNNGNELNVTDIIEAHRKGLVQGIELCKINAE